MPQQFKQVFNLKTGKSEKVALSPEEQAEFELNETEHERTKIPRAQNNLIERVKQRRKIVEENSVVTVNVAGVPYEWSATPKAQARLFNVLTAINSGIVVPNPRNWTPKDKTQTVSCTHDDLKNIAAAIIIKMDEIHDFAKMYEKNIKTMEDENIIESTNIQIGWPK